MSIGIAVAPLRSRQVSVAIVLGGQPVLKHYIISACASEQGAVPATSAVPGSAALWPSFGMCGSRLGLLMHLTSDVCINKTSVPSCAGFHGCSGLRP